MNTIVQRLSELGLVLPIVNPPVANYLTTTRIGDLLLVSGQIGHPGATASGPVGAGLSLDEARLEAQTAGLSLLAAIDAAVDGDSDRIEQVLRVGVFIAAAPGFDNHSHVANGVSDLLVDVLGDRGRHARTAVGVASLPAGSAVEVDALVKLRPTAPG
jgi:enamine deaminase RidA (YjgF/YER057c/UK114 family)